MKDNIELGEMVKLPGDEVHRPTTEEVSSLGAAVQKLLPPLMEGEAEKKGGSQPPGINRFHLAQGLNDAKLRQIIQLHVTKHLPGADDLCGRGSTG